MSYEKMKEYVESLFNVFIMINDNESVKKDRRFQIITLVIFNYVRKMAKDNDVDLGKIEIKKPKPVKSNDKKSNIENKLAEPIDSDSNSGDENNAFENYVSKRKNKIKEKYPYLDEQGILKKLKKKWKHLSDDKKNKF